MKHFVITAAFCFCVTTLLGQKVNLIIQVNEKIAESISSVRISFDSSGITRHAQVSYIPGELQFDSTTWHIINADTSRKLSLDFIFYTYEGGKQKTDNYFVEFYKRQLLQRYLILNIYDFSKKLYRKWYGSYTKNNFFAEIRCPTCGIRIRNL